MATDRIAHKSIQNKKAKYVSGHTHCSGLCSKFRKLILYVTDKNLT